MLFKQLPKPEDVARFLDQASGRNFFRQYYNCLMSNLRLSGVPMRVRSGKKGRVTNPHQVWPLQLG